MQDIIQPPSDTSPQQNDETGLDHNQDPEWRAESKRRTVTSWAILGVAIALLLFICRFYISGDKNTEIAIAGILGIVTVFIYSRQWHAMRDGLQKTDQIVTQNKQIIGVMKAQQIAASASAIWAREQVGKAQGQTDVMIEALTETRKVIEQNERSIKASQEQAVAAQDMLEHSKTATTAIERAYLGVKLFLKGNRRFTVGEVPQIEFLVKNGGKTPAFEVAASVRVAVTEKTTIAEVENEAPKMITRNKIGNRILSGDTESGFSELTKPITQKVLAGLEARVTKFYVLVNVFYFDFEHTQQTDAFYFCFDLDRDGGSFVLCRE